VKSKSILAMVLLGGAVALTAVSVARADVVFYTGYYDLPPPQGGNSSPLPDPWYGSPNTTFYGNAGQAQSGDPDESGFLIVNTGPSAVTLSQGVTIGGFQLWDSFIGAGGTVIGSGQNLILSGSGNFDGSDIGFNYAVINITIDGIAHSYTDSGNVLFGSLNGAANETLPWAEIGRISAATATTPLPAALPLFATGLGALGLLALRRKRKALAAA
jgi:hypothetical protein